MTDTFTSARKAIEAAIDEIKREREAYLKDADAKLATLEAALKPLQGPVGAGARAPKAKPKAPVVPFSKGAANPKQPHEFAGKNAPIVARFLQEHSGVEGKTVTQVELSKATGINSAEIIRALRIMQRAGVVERIGRVPSAKKGAPTIGWKWIGPAPEQASAPKAEPTKREIVIAPGLGIREGRLKVGA